MIRPAALLVAALPALAVAAGPRSAAAESFFEIAAPEGFANAGPLGRSIAREVSRTRYFGEPPTDSGADAYADPDRGAVYVWWAEGAPSDAPASAIRAAFDRLQRAPSESSPQAASVSIDRWDEELEDGVARAELTWRHLSNETLTRARALAFASAEGAPRLVVAECVMHVEREGDMRAPCDAVLSSLAITTPPPQRMALTELPEGELPELTANVPDFTVGEGEELTAEASESAKRSSGPQIGEPQAGVLYEQHDTGNRGGDRPPWLLILGALLVAAAVYATVRGRHRSEGENPAPDDEREERSAAETNGQNEGEQDDEGGDEPR